jgi:hypothetical protein
MTTPARSPSDTTPPSGKISPQGDTRQSARLLAEETFHKADRKAMMGPRFAVPGWPGHAIAFIDAFTAAIEARDATWRAEVERFSAAFELLRQSGDTATRRLERALELLDARAQRMRNLVPTQINLTKAMRAEERADDAKASAAVIREALAALPGPALQPGVAPQEVTSMLASDYDAVLTGAAPPPSNPGEAPASAPTATKKGPT